MYGYDRSNGGNFRNTEKGYLPAVQETRDQSLGWEDPLEKEMATYSSILAWKISWTERWWAAVCGVAKSWA